MTVLKKIMNFLYTFLPTLAKAGVGFYQYCFLSAMSVRSELTVIVFSHEKKLLRDILQVVLHFLTDMCYNHVGRNSN